MSLKIAVPDLVSNSYLPAAAAAVELGFFKEEGLDVVLEPIFPVDNTYAAMRDGQIDLIFGTWRDRMPSPVDAVSSYFHAKDGNRPFLLRRAFAEDVHLEMVVKTDAISFPSSAKGLATVEEVLVRRIANDFENVYSFGLARPTDADRRRFACPWLVAMSAKNNGLIRVGSGHYDWHFSSDASCMVEKLIITIDVMQVLRANEVDRIMEWIGSLPYPWCRPDEVVRNMPPIEALAPVERYLKELVDCSAD